MKKFLSLVLALVMTMSLVTVSAGAKDFTDDSEITYKEAVDVISALGVVDGYSGGDFRPDDVLTRGAAAKIICNLILGPTTASALSAGTAPFKDVPVTNTFAGYITYCSQQGIISGYADGTFRPTGTLSGNAFMKMLLGALGYDSSIEGYTGPNWTVSVIKQAVGIGLDDGNDEFVGSKAVTRQEAALYAVYQPRATEEIDGMIRMIQTLIEKGHAYEVDGTVYFKTRSFEEYGKLSKKNIDDLEAGHREIKVTGEEGKKRTLWILFSGNQRKKERFPGSLRGEKDVQDGILSVLKCPKNILGIPLISMPEEKI